MTPELFNYHLKAFVATHGIAGDLSSRVVKLKEEVKELEEAVTIGEPAEIIKEAADCAIVCFHIMLILGASPLWTMYLKLEEVAARPKYKAMSAQVNRCTCGDATHCGNSNNL